jgi:hypothetical protein
VSWKKKSMTIDLMVHECDEHCRRPKTKTDGPSKANSEQYIKEYQRIFGGKPNEGKA